MNELFKWQRKKKFEIYESLLRDKKKTAPACVYHTHTVGCILVSIVTGRRYVLTYTSAYLFWHLLVYDDAFFHRKWIVDSTVLLLIGTSIICMMHDATTKTTVLQLYGSVVRPSISPVPYSIRNSTGFLLSFVEIGYRIRNDCQRYMENSSTKCRTAGHTTVLIFSLSESLIYCKNSKKYKIPQSQPLQLQQQ